MQRYLLAVLTAATLLSSVHADELSDAAVTLCSKIKQCARADMEANAMSPSAQSDVDAMLESMCGNIQQELILARSHTELYAPATACIKSLGKSSCEVVQGEDVTNECQQFERQLRQFSDIGRE